MWERIFLLSLVVHFIGVMILLAGGLVLTHWEPVTSPVGGSIAGIGGLAGIVSGLVLVFNTPLPGRDR